MKYIIPFFIAIIFNVASSSAQKEAKTGNKAEPVIIRNANYVDIVKGTIKKADLLIENGKIAKLGNKLKAPNNTMAIDGTAKWIIPGLVDAHIHLFQSGGLYTRPDALDLTAYRSYEKERTWLKNNAPDLMKRYLRVGITTVIDVGGPLYNFDVKNRLADNTQYPNLFLTGPLISTYQPKAFEIDDPPIIKAASKEEAVNLVKKQIPLKPDFIKIWYIARDKEEADKNYDIVKATIEESHMHGLKVAVHATQLYTATLAVKAGADILVHSVEDKPVDKDFISMVKRNKVAYIPTLIVGKNYLEVFSGQLQISKEDFALSNPIPLGSVFDPSHMQSLPDIKRYKEYALGKLKDTEKDKIMLDNLKKLTAEGVTVATGTDAGNIGTMHASSYYEEVNMMKKAGLSNANILKASTINAAKALGKESIFGSIEQGKMADLVILNQNPLENIDAIKDIAYVIKAGNVFSIDTIIYNTPEQLVQQQVNGYNAGNIEAFLAPYSEDLEIHDFPEELIRKGKSEIKNRYAALFKAYPELHCEIINRMVLGNTVIDHEKITGIPGQTSLEAIAIYKIEGGKIKKVFFERNK